MIGLDELIPRENLASFCKRWKITQVDLFGSALRDDFSGKSDIDLLITFQDGATPGFFGFVEMKAEFEKLLGRPVDVMTRRSIERSLNPYRKEEILGTAQTIYEDEAA